MKHDEKVYLNLNKCPAAVFLAPESQPSGGGAAVC
jgi:hypothetical protein